MEVFPRLGGVIVREAERDERGCRTWLIGPARGESAEALKALFLRCGRYQGFVFRPPGEDMNAIARFETDTLRVAESGEVEPLTICELPPGDQPAVTPAPQQGSVRKGWP